MLKDVALMVKYNKHMKIIKDRGTYILNMFE